MKILVPLLFAVSSLAVAPGFVLASTDVAATCGPNATEGMKRPGGYCDQIESTDNIGTERDRSPDTCHLVGDLGPVLLQRGVRIDVATNNLCCNYSEATMPNSLPPGLLPTSDAAPDRIIVLASPCY